MSSLRTRYRQLALDSRQDAPCAFPTLLWLFIAGSLMGFVMEGVWHMLRTGEWGFRVATLWGPFCIIYGAGAVCMYLVALKVERRRPLHQFITFALAGSAVECLSSLFQEAAFGTVSWDYSHHALNLGGRISLRMTLIWGLLGMALMYLLLPLLAVSAITAIGAVWHIVRMLCKRNRDSFVTLVLFALLIWYYLFLPGAISAPRYHLPVLPCACSFASAALLDAVNAFRRRKAGSASGTESGSR